MINFLRLLTCGVILSLAVASPFERFKRQVTLPDRNQGQFGNRDPTLVRGPFTGFGQFQPGQNFQGVGSNGITIPGNGGTQIFRQGNMPPPIGSQPGSGLTIPGDGGLATGSFIGFQNQNSLQQTTRSPQVTTPAAGTSGARTTPSQAYFRCLERCRTTNEYNPVCGDDGQNYQNMQRLACAQNCGTRVQFVRRGTCLPR